MFASLFLPHLPAGNMLSETGFYQDGKVCITSGSGIHALDVMCTLLPVIICMRTLSIGAVAVLLIAPAWRRLLSVKYRNRAEDNRLGLAVPWCCFPLFSITMMRLLYNLDGNCDSDQSCDAHLQMLLPESV